jgi:hypothetical protein
LGAVDLPRDALSRSQRSKALNAFGVAKDLDVDVAVAIGEAEDGFLQTLAELISTPSLELLPLKSENNTKRGDFASSSTIGDIRSSNARS